MEKSSLIQVSPEIKLKGFKANQIRYSSDESGTELLLQRLKSSEAERGRTLLNSERIELVPQIMKSYEKYIRNQPLCDVDFVLSSHELVEVSRIDDIDLWRYLTYRYMYNKYPELKIVGKYPPSVQIEPSSLCNFRCVMCYQTDKSYFRNSNKDMGTMSLPTFECLIDELEGNVESITLASRGEPLLNKNISKMLNYMSGKFLAIKLNTNASLLNEDLIHSILSANIQTLVFSIDANSKDMYEKIRRGGNFERLISNLNLYKRIKDSIYPESKIITRISGVKINDEQSIEEMADSWAKYADLVAFTNYTPWHDSYENPIKSEIQQPCSELWRRIFVWQNGTINPCDYDYKSLLSSWKFPETSIAEAWQSLNYNELRKAHLEKRRGQIEPCKRCISI